MVNGQTGAPTLLAQRLVEVALIFEKGVVRIPDQQMAASLATELLEKVIPVTPDRARPRRPQQQRLQQLPPQRPLL